MLRMSLLLTWYAGRELANNSLASNSQGEQTNQPPQQQQLGDQC